MHNCLFFFLFILQLRFLIYSIVKKVKFELNFVKNVLLVTRKVMFIHFKR